MTQQDHDDEYEYELLPSSRIEYALDEIGVYKWQDNYDEMADMLITYKCPGDILDWGEPVVDEKTAAFDTNGHIAGCRGITCKECWNKEAANDTI